MTFHCIHGCRHDLEGEPYIYNLLRSGILCRDAVTMQISFRCILFAVLQMSYTSATAAVTYGL